MQIAKMRLYDAQHTGSMTLTSKVVIPVCCFLCLLLLGKASVLVLFKLLLPQTPINNQTLDGPVLRSSLESQQEVMSPVSAQTICQHTSNLCLLCLCSDAMFLQGLEKLLNTALINDRVYSPAKS